MIHDVTWSLCYVVTHHNWTYPNLTKIHIYQYVGPISDQICWSDQDAKLLTISFRISASIDLLIFYCWFIMLVDSFCISSCFSSKMDLNWLPWKQTAWSRGEAMWQMGEHVSHEWQQIADRLAYTLMEEPMCNLLFFIHRVEKLQV